MPLDADTIVDRRRLRRKLTFWRVLAFADRGRGDHHRGRGRWPTGAVDWREPADRSRG